MKKYEDAILNTIIDKDGVRITEIDLNIVSGNKNLDAKEISNLFSSFIKSFKIR